MIKYILYQNDEELERFKKHNIFKDNIYFKSKIFNIKNKDKYNVPRFDNKYNNFYNKKLNKNQLNHLYSIKTIIEDSIKNNYKEIMILEYDVYFHKEFNYLYNKYKKLIDNNDIIHLGSSQHQWYDKFSGDKIKINKYNDLMFYKNTHSLGTFAVILKERVYDEYLNFINYCLYEDNFYPSDVILSIISKNYKSIVLYPNLIICDISKSTILKRDNYRKNLITFKWILSNYII